MALDPDHQAGGAKAPDAFRTISEVAEDLDLPQHVLRFWETRFSQIRPMKRGGGRRYYRPDDVGLLRGIRQLLYGQGYTIKGVQRILKERGPRFVIAIGLGQAEIGAAPAAPTPAERAHPADRPGDWGHARPHAMPPDAMPPDEAELAEEDLAAVAGENDEGPVPAGYEDGYAIETAERAAELEDGAPPVDPGPVARARRFIDRLRPDHGGPVLGRDDIRRLEATLADLLECKRLLDQVR